MTSIPTEPFNPPEHDQLLTHYDQEKNTVWHYLNPRSRACFTACVLSGMNGVQAEVKQYRDRSREAAEAIRYLVLASATPSVFNLGGDLDFFVRSIREGDRNALSVYARLCIDCVYGYASHLEQSGITTIALVQGKALGGGFEAALSCNVLIAERCAQFGLPEILFNLFPGMGAYSFLARRVDSALAERFLLDGKLHSAEALYEMGVVDVLAEPGEGVRAVCDYVRRRERAPNGFDAVQRLREWRNPVTREELIRVTELWVESAMRLRPRDLRTMNRLVAAQYRLQASVSPTELRAADERIVTLRSEVPATVDGETVRWPNKAAAGQAR